MDDLTRARNKRKIKNTLEKGRIAIAPQTKTAQYHRETMLVLTTIAEITGHGPVKDALVTDLSCICDFFSFGQPSRSDLAELSRKLHLSVQADDLLWQVAKRLLQK